MVQEGQSTRQMKSGKTGTMKNSIFKDNIYDTRYEISIMYGSSYEIRCFRASGI
jgi:hypothetical protein